MIFIKEEYFNWLIAKIGGRVITQRYHDLLLYLSQCEFRWSRLLETDSCRADDGLELRSQYLSEYGARRTEFREPCSVLEMMIALAIRIEIEITGAPGNDHPERWFWMMIQNLGLDQFTNETFNREDVDDILNYWMDRRYDRHGRGGLFPVLNSTLDQTTRPIWDQMCSYVSNYIYRNKTFKEEEV